MKKDLIISLSWGVSIVALALVASYARNIGMIDQETVKRLVLGASGLMIAAFGNRMPKAFAPTFAAQQVTRVGGWSMTVSGLIYTALWAFAPFQTAVVGGSTAVIIGIAITFSYCLRLRSRTKTI